VRTDCGQGATATSDASVPAKEPKPEFNVGDKMRVNLITAMLSTPRFRTTMESNSKWMWSASTSRR